MKTAWTVTLMATTLATCTMEPAFASSSSGADLGDFTLGFLTGIMLEGRLPTIAVLSKINTRDECLTAARLTSNQNVRVRILYSAP